MPLSKIQIEEGSPTNIEHDYPEHLFFEKMQSIMEEQLDVLTLFKEFLVNRGEVRDEKPEIITLYQATQGPIYYLDYKGYIYAYLLQPAATVVFDAIVSGVGSVKLQPPVGWFNLRMPNNTGFILDATNPTPQQNFMLLRSNNI